ncbi:MAG: hypothetical protein ACYC1U_00980 [Candidatus Aquicultorales bacterium]
MSDMKSMKLRLAVLLAIIAAIVAISINTLLGASDDEKGRAPNTVKSAAGDQVPRRATVSITLSVPADLVKVDEVDDNTFGRVLTYSDGTNGPYERSFWLQAWDSEVETVEQYGADKSWWLESTESITVMVGAERAQLSSQIDPGGVDGGPAVQWFRMAWRKGSIEYRLVSRNLSQPEVEQIVASLK